MINAVDQRISNFNTISNSVAKFTTQHDYPLWRHISLAIYLLPSSGSVSIYSFMPHTHSDCPPFSMVRRGAHKDFSIMKKNAQLTGGHLSLATACGSNSSSRRRQPAAGLPPSNLIEFNICRCILYIGLCSYTIYADQLSEPR